MIALIVGGTAGTNWGRLEILVLAAAAVLAAILLVIRFFRSADRKKRRAAAVGYYDRDAARYGMHGGSSFDRPEEEAPLVLAPSFVAPKAAGRGRSSAPTVPPSGSVSTEFVRAFDPVEAERLRPPMPVPEAESDAAPPPAPPPPPPPAPSPPTPSPGSRIPLLDVPPPPTPTR